MSDIVLRIAVAFAEPLRVQVSSQLIDQKLDNILTLITESNKKIMSQLTDVIAAINAATNEVAASAAADATQTEANAAAVQALRDQIAILIANDGTPTTANLQALDDIQKSLSSTKASLDATAARLQVIASDPQNPVPPRP